MKRDVFHHCAYEVYPDLLDGMRALLPFVVGNDRTGLAERFVELHREAHARYSRPYHLARGEAEEIQARLATFGLGDVVLPAIAADGKWRYVVRSLARLERVRELGGPVELFRDDWLAGARDLTATPYEPPTDLTWHRPGDFVREAISLAATTYDDVGIGDAINETPEAHAFFERYPGAYSFWDIHGTPDAGEDPDLPDPLRYPAAIWSAAAIELAEPFADLPCGMAGRATIQPPDVPPRIQLHTMLVTACAAAAGRGHALVGFVEVRT